MQSHVSHKTLEVLEEPRVSWSLDVEMTQLREGETANHRRIQDTSIYHLIP